VAPLQGWIEYSELSPPEQMKKEKLAKKNAIVENPIDLTVETSTKSAGGALNKQSGKICTKITKMNNIKKQQDG